MFLLLADQTKSVPILRWLLANPTKRLEWKPLTDQMKRAGILNDEGQFSEELGLLIEVVTQPEILECLPRDAKERQFAEFLETLKPDNANAILEILAEAAEMRGRNPKVSPSNGQRVLNLFRTAPLDSDWLAAGSLQGPPSERIVWPLLRDLWPEGLKAPQGKVRERRGRPVSTLPSQLIIHIGSRTLRVALFCGKQSSELHQFVNVANARKSWLEASGFELSVARTVSFSRVQPGPWDLTDQALYDFVVASWGTLRAWIVEIQNALGGSDGGASNDASAAGDRASEGTLSSPISGRAAHRRKTAKRGLGTQAEAE